MNKVLLALLVTLGCMASLQAEESVDQDANQLHQHNFLGKRPYAKAPVAKQQNPDEKWVGAGIVTDSPDKGVDKHQQMRLNFISKRPYIGTPSNE